MEWQMQIVEDILWAGSIDNGVPDDITSLAPKHLYHCSAPCELIYTYGMYVRGIGWEILHMHSTNGSHERRRPLHESTSLLFILYSHEIHNVCPYVPVRY